MFIMKSLINNNSEYYDDLDKNFNAAIKLCQQEYSHQELLKMLKTGNIPQKQIAALKFDYVNDKNDAMALIDNLTGCDGKIRESVAQKINMLIQSDINTASIFAQISADAFADATVDINANICRLIVDSAFILKNYDSFSRTYTDKIIEFAKESLCELDKFIFRDKKYVINKQIFKLYWCLEALSEFYIFADNHAFAQIIEKSAAQTEYTIREKTAQIISKNSGFENIKAKLINDDNYYVRQALHH